MRKESLSEARMPSYQPKAAQGRTAPWRDTSCRGSVKRYRAAGNGHHRGSCERAHLTRSETRSSACQTVEEESYSRAPVTKGGTFSAADECNHEC